MIGILTLNNKGIHKEKISPKNLSSIFISCICYFREVFVLYDILKEWFSNFL